MHALKSLVLAPLLISIISCGKASAPAEDSIRQKLVGTWLSETEFEETKTRTVTNLDQDGAFREIEKTVPAKGGTVEATYAGEWSFDGVNFKRKYMNKDGRLLPNSKFEYATYAVSMVGINEFMGTDNIQKQAVKFTRTNVDTRPQ